MRCYGGNLLKDNASTHMSLTRRISSYLGKQTSLELIALDAFNSDLSHKEMRRSQLTISYQEGEAQQLHQPLLLRERNRRASGEW